MRWRIAGRECKRRRRRSNERGAGRAVAVIRNDAASGTSPYLLRLKSPAADPAADPAVAEGAVGRARSGMTFRATQPCPLSWWPVQMDSRMHLRAPRNKPVRTAIRLLALVLRPTHSAMLKLRIFPINQHQEINVRCRTACDQTQPPATNLDPCPMTRTGCLPTHGAVLVPRPTSSIRSNTKFPPTLLLPSPPNT